MDQTGEGSLLTGLKMSSYVLLNVCLEKKKEKKYYCVVDVQLFKGFEFQVLFHACIEHLTVNLIENC